jgi:predicted NACHT family NTPase
VSFLRRWQQVAFRGIQKGKSKYAHFEADRKYEFLCHLAYRIKATVFSSLELLSVFEDIREEYGFASREAVRVIGEIESHNGLLIQSGFDQFEFAHKSFQEFLTAEYLVKRPIRISPLKG